TLFLFLQLRQGDESRVTGDGERLWPSPADPRKSWRRWGIYLLLGSLGGLGILSKYNYTIFFFALILAGLSLKSWRPSIWNVRALAALGITLLIVIPNLIWMKNHPNLAFASMNKFDIDPSHSFKSMARGIGSWAFTCLDQIGVLVVVFAVVCWRGLGKSLRYRMSSAGENHGFSLVLRVIIFTGGIVVLGILISGATNCRNRWLQPLVIPTPILLAALCQDQLKGHRLIILLLLAGAVALAVAIAAPGRI